MTEEWRTTPKLAGRYEISNLGRARNTKTGVLLRPDRTRGYLRYTFSTEEGVIRTTVHRLICEAWHGPPPPGGFACHINDDPTDNRPENLYWGTPRSNTQDAVRNGKHRNVAKTHCPKGHPYDEDNTQFFRGYQRRCKTCSREWAAVSRARRKREGLKDGDPRHGTLTGYTSYFCRCDECKQAASNHYYKRKAENG